MVTLMLMLTSVLAFDGGLPCESTLWLGEVDVLFGSDAVVLMCTWGGGEWLVVSSPAPQTKVCCSIAEDLRQLPVSDSPKAEGMLHAPETFGGKLTMGFGCCRAEGGNNDCLRGNSTRCSIDELPKRYGEDVDVHLRYLVEGRADAVEEARDFGRCEIECCVQFLRRRVMSDLVLKKAVYAGVVFITNLFGDGQHPLHPR